MIRCPHCGHQHDVALFQFSRKIRCQCGKELDLSLIQTIEDFERYLESVEERERALEIQEAANRICQMILDDSCPVVDIEIAKSKLKERVGELFPEKIALYEMIYEARFKRLWEQFRE
jgi:hypothetical protein